LSNHNLDVIPHRADAVRETSGPRSPAPLAPLVAQANAELMRPLRGLPATHCPLAPLANNTLQATILPANSHALRALRVAGRIAPELAIMQWKMKR